MTEDETYRVLRTLLVQVDAESVVLGTTDTPLTDIIHSHQTAPPPLGGYAIITPLGTRDTGEGFRTCYDDVVFQGVPRVVELRTVGVALGFRLDVFAVGATDYARAFHTALTSARAQLELLPLVVSEIAEVDHTPQIVGQNWEDRARFNVTLATARTQSTLIDVIERGHIAIAGSGSRPTPITTNADFPKE